MKKLNTWANRSSFAYEGSVETGTTIYYGKKQYKTTVSAEQYQKMINTFKHREVPIGTSRDDASKGSLGAWLKNNVDKRALASYIGAILLCEGYAKRDRSTIIFK